MEQTNPRSYFSLSSSSRIHTSSQTAVVGLAECELRPGSVSGSSKIDRLVFDSFLRLRRCSRGAVVAISDRIMITNSTAGEFLLPSDRPRLWTLAQAVFSEGRKPAREIVLSSGASVLARCQAVLAQGVLVGALLQLSNPLQVRVRSTSPTPIDSVMTAWQSLTNAERAVAEVVALGLTNREAGRRVYMSAHTVDAHLRQIFRKLGINSRVELARIVGEHHHQLQNIDGFAAASEPYGSLQDEVMRSA